MIVHHCRSEIFDIFARVQRKAHRILNEKQIHPHGHAHVPLKNIITFIKNIDPNKNDFKILQEIYVSFCHNGKREKQM